MSSMLPAPDAEPATPLPQTPRWSRAQRWILALAALLVAMGVMWFSTAEDSLTLHAGDVAPRDVLAPYSHAFQSEVLTEKKREAAAQAVPRVYAPPDASLGRQQLERLRAALTFITAVRNDPYAAPEEKLRDLAAIRGLNLAPDEARYLLTMDDQRWQAIQKEAQRVLETMMRAPIREDQLEDARRNVPAFIDLTLPERQANLVQRLVEAFLAPNSLYSPELTEAAREKAREAVQPVTRSYRRGETIVQRGQVLSEADIEALREYGLLQGTARWQAILAPLLMTLLAFGVVILYLHHRRQDLGASPRELWVITVVFLAFLTAARLAMPGHIVVPYLFPLATFTLLFYLLFGAETTLALSVPLVALSLYNLPHGYELVVYHLLVGVVGVVLVGRAQRLRKFLSAGAGMALAGGLVLLSTRLPSPATDLAGMMTLLVAAVFNGAMAAALALIVHYFLAPWLGQVTPFQLLELSRPDQPLLQRLLRDAPGTYQHSLQVANLAEQAARAVGADALLTRVGALYHDVGKALNPQFFIENQPPGGVNPHQDLSPLESARVIIRHVPDGLALAQQHHLPRRVQAFIAEHHGTMLTRYQYARALEEADGDASRVNPEDFRYPGPRPQSKETALVMLADGCEARSRAERPADEHALRRLVHETIADRIREGQLSDTDLTLQDLQAVENTIVATLKGIYHPRIKYPDPRNPEQKTIPVSKVLLTLRGEEGETPAEPSEEGEAETKAEAETTITGEEVVHAESTSSD